LAVNVICSLFATYDRP